MPRIHAVFFDVGETIVDETREFGAWADWLGVPRHTFSAVFGAMIAKGHDHRHVFEQFKPGFDMGDERTLRPDQTPEEQDLYADARPCLQALRDLGIRVGLAADQPGYAEVMLKALDLPVDVIGTAETWGVDKPAPEFFAKLVEQSECSPENVLYVGDRLDDDVAPARAAGLQTVFIRRGPWGYIVEDETLAERCLFRLNALTDLPGLVEHHNASIG